MKSQDVKESHFEAIKILTDLEGNLSTCHYFAILSNGFGGRIQGLKSVRLTFSLVNALVYVRHFNMFVRSHM